jgi:hypothetical protein
VIGSRLKQSGMFWTVRGANAILALRAAPISMDALRTIGKSAATLGRHDIHFYVARPVSECSREVQLFSPFRLAALCSWQAIWKSGISRRLSEHPLPQAVEVAASMSKKEPPRSFGRPANLTIPELN